MTRPVVPQAPDFPVRGEPRAQFAAKANATVAAQPAIIDAQNALGEWFEQQADIVAEAVPAAQVAIAAANYKGEWLDLTGSLSVPASVSHNDRYWMLTENVADVTLVEPGVSPVWLEIRTGPTLGKLHAIALSF